VAYVKLLSGSARAQCPGPGKRAGRSPKVGKKVVFFDVNEVRIEKKENVENEGRSQQGTENKGKNQRHNGLPQ
jgi:hypothetical protein